MTRWLAIGIAVVGVLLVFYALFSAESDEERIRARLEQLAAAVAIAGEESPLFRTSRISGEFEEIFTKDVRYKIPELTSGERGREGLIRLAAQSGIHFTTLDVTFTDVDVQMIGGGTGATAHTTATLRAMRRGRPERDDRQVRFDFSKTDDGWQIDSVRVRPPDDD